MTTSPAHLWIWFGVVLVACLVFFGTLHGWIELRRSVQVAIGALLCSVGTIGVFMALYPSEAFVVAVVPFAVSVTLADQAAELWRAGL